MKALPQPRSQFLVSHQGSPGYIPDEVASELWWKFCCWGSECFGFLYQFLLEIGVNVVDWIGLAQDRYRWRALVNSVMNLRVP
jgi:hypothetical protein